MQHKFWIVLFSILGSSWNSLAADEIPKTKSSDSTVERNLEVTTENPNLLQARKELLEIAVEQVSQEFIRKIIGEQKYTRNSSLIRTKVIARSGRYIPEMKSQDPIPNGTGFKMVVQMKISQPALEAVLLENGLFYEADGPPVIISMVQWLDRLQLRSFGWWNPDSYKNALLGKLSLAFEQNLRGQLQKQNFYLLPAQAEKYGEALSKVEQVETIKIEDQQNLAHRFSAQIFIQGQVLINRSSKDLVQLVAHVFARQTSDGRSLAEVYRTIDLGRQANDFQIEKKGRELIELVNSEIASQIVGVWQRGVLGSEVHRMVFIGALTPLDREKLKEKILSLNKEIRSVKERYLGSEETVFEVETPIKLNEFSGRIPQVSFMGAAKLKTFAFDNIGQNSAVYRMQ